MVGAIAQPNAEDNVAIIGYFDVDGGGGIPERSSNEINLTVGNAPAGSGTAKISPDSVEAGSFANLTVSFTAQGTMNGGQVALQMPDGWGDLQQTDENADNYVQVTGLGGGDPTWDTNNDIVEANLGNDFGKGDTVKFVLENVVAQLSDLGVAEFTIYSGGSDGELVELVVGEAPKPGAYTNTGTDVKLLLGRVYTTDCIDDDKTPDIREDYNGLLRVAVTGGGDGAGTATVEIVDSERSGDYNYVDDAATLLGENQLHSGDIENSANLIFTYSPVETIVEGKLRFTVPSSDWDSPNDTSASTPGFTLVESDGSVGEPIFSNGSLTVEIHLISREDTITINYGAERGLVTPPTTVGPAEFEIDIQGSETGNFKPIARQPVVHIRPQASGRGTATVEADGDVYAGSTGNSFTITYTSVGQVVDGDLKITVPDTWSATSADTFDISGGSVTYGDPSVTDDDGRFHRWRRCCQRSHYLRYQQLESRWILQRHIRKCDGAGRSGNS